MSKELLAQLDARASLLGLNRSQYLSQLARNDLIDGGDMTVREQPATYKTNSANSAAVNEAAMKIVSAAASDVRAGAPVALPAKVVPPKSVDYRRPSRKKPGSKHST